MYLHAHCNGCTTCMQMERDAANELTQTAQEGYNTVRQQYDAKREEAEPHRARRRELREAVNSLQVGRFTNDTKAG
jgi:uncharacterized coiled-coil DUF342 family protein